jgi:hypothetical protein
MRLNGNVNGMTAGTSNQAMRVHGTRASGPGVEDVPIHPV